MLFTFLNSFFGKHSSSIAASSTVEFRVFYYNKTAGSSREKRAYTFAGFFSFDIGNDARKSAYFLELYFYLAAALQLIYYSNEGYYLARLYANAYSKPTKKSLPCQTTFLS